MNAYHLNIHIAPGGSSTAFHVMEYTAEITELVKSQFAYQNIIGLPSERLVKKLENP